MARGTVAVLAAEGFGGQGGGQSAWPPLLKRQLLGAKDEPEVAATQVLEPLLPLGEMPSLGRFLPPTADEKQLALLARALGTAAVLRPELCARLLREDHRAIWIASAESAESAETQVEVLRFIRMSCEVVGRGAVAWWLKEEGTKLLTLLRRSVLSPLKGKGSSNFEALCAVEALRCWITFLRCGAGCDRLESFAAEIGSYWHRFAVQHFEGDVMESHFLLTAHLLELTLEVFRLREAQEVEEPVDPLQSLHAGIASAVSSAFCAASPVLAKRLTRVENTSSAQQLCLATFTDVLDVAVSAAMAAQRLEGVDSPLPQDLWPKRELKTPAAHTCAILLVRDNRPEIGPFISFRLQMRSFRILPLSLAVMFGDASEIAILPNAKLVMDGSELPAEVQSKHDLLKIEGPGKHELPETIEDVEARWLGMALSQIGWFLSESPLSLGKKATSWMLSAEEVSSRSKHQSMALSLLETLGVSLAEQKPTAPIPHHPHTMFGGIPWLLIIPVVLGVVLAILIQAVSLYSEWSEAKEKQARGEPIEADLGYGY